ncbi:MAG: adenylate/guanylate cyclase domain-containing protein [Gordonia amarae]
MSGPDDLPLPDEAGGEQLGDTTGSGAPGGSGTGRAARGAASAGRKAAHLLARTDSSETAVRAARAARSLLPPGVDTDADRFSGRVGRLIGRSRPDQPSAARELGLAAVSAWQGLVSRRSPRSTEPTRATILFTDLVGFSTWALRAGDDLILALLGEVNSATETVVREHGGRIVKSLGDGTMAVFTDAAAAIEAGHEVVGAVSALQVQGYRPQLRAGLHTGEPRPVDDDYLGVDVNIAARVADAAGAGELLVTKDTLTAAVGDDVDPATRYALRRRRFKAKGVPRTVEVFAVVPRYRS